MSELEELRRHGQAVVKLWERLGQCEDEFAPDYDPPACNEWREALDTAIQGLSTALADHAYMTATAPAQHGAGLEHAGERGTEGMATFRMLTSARTGDAIWVNLDTVQTIRDDHGQARLWFGDDNDGGLLVEESVEAIID